MSSKTNLVTTNKIGAMEVKDDTHPNVWANYYPPGAVLAYLLPEVDKGELFDPISACAMRESGYFGPLSEENLKSFLLLKLDKQEKFTVDVILRYTEDVKNLSIQLFNLESRINQIVTTENHRTDFLKRRIQDIVEAVMERKVPSSIQNQLHLSYAARNALQQVGSQGPLKGGELMGFIHIGMCNQPVSMNELMKQLNDFQLSIISEVNIEKLKYKFSPCKILNALEEILRELMTI